MKKLLVSFLFASTAITGTAQQTAMETWKPLLNQPKLAEYFSGTFNYLGIRIAETGEAFTVHHLGRSFELTAGIDPAKADFTVTLHQENIDNMLKHGADAQIDEAESFRIMRVLFTPLTEAELNNPYLTKRRYLKMAKVEQLIHVTLLDPEKKENHLHSLIYCDGQWLAIPGHYGKAGRSFLLQPKDAVEFQRQLFKAKTANTKKSWMQFMRWYKDWRETVSS